MMTEYDLEVGVNTKTRNKNKIEYDIKETK